VEQGNTIHTYSLRQPETRDVENIPVKNDKLNYLYGPSAAYLDKLNRIYYFGGRIWNSMSRAWEDQDDIWYIDLSSEFSCKDRPNGKSFKYSIYWDFCKLN